MVRLVPSQARPTASMIQARPEPGRLARTRLPGLTLRPKSREPGSCALHGYGHGGEGGVTDETLRLVNVMLDLSRGCLRDSGGAEIALRPKSLEVLLALARN